MRKCAIYFIPQDFIDEIIDISRLHEAPSGADNYICLSISIYVR